MHACTWLNLEQVKRNNKYQTLEDLYDYLELQSNIDHLKTHNIVLLD
jgi:hypothetical protein